MGVCLSCGAVQALSAIGCGVLDRFFWIDPLLSLRFYFRIYSTLLILFEERLLLTEESLLA
jgi:hypothetical protein